MSKNHDTTLSSSQHEETVIEENAAPCAPITEWQVQEVADLLSCHREWRSMLRKAPAKMPDEHIARAEQTHSGKDITDIIFDAVLRWIRSTGPVSACQMYHNLELVPQRRELYKILLEGHECPLAKQALDQPLYPSGIMLVGATGSGKSSTGNSIVGKNVFETKMCAQSVTMHCSSCETDRHGFPMTVVDAPGLFDTERSDEEVAAELEKVVEMTYPGPNAFCLVIRAGRFSREQQDAMRNIKETFGEDVLKYTIVVFTGMDDLTRKNIPLEQFIQEGPECLKELIASCGNRYMGINNETDDQKLKDEHLSHLFEYMKEIRKDNSMPFFTNAMLEMVKKDLKKLKDSMNSMNMQINQLQKEMSKLVTDTEQKNNEIELLRGNLAEIQSAERRRVVLKERLNQSRKILVYKDVFQTHFNSAAEQNMMRYAEIQSAERRRVVLQERLNQSRKIPVYKEVFQTRFNSAAEEIMMRRDDDVHMNIMMRRDDDVHMNSILLWGLVSVMIIMIIISVAARVLTCANQPTILMGIDSYTSKIE